jgi:hypothetical protein
MTGNTCAHVIRLLCVVRARWFAPYMPFQINASHDNGRYDGSVRMGHRIGERIHHLIRDRKAAPFVRQVLHITSGETDLQWQKHPLRQRQQWNWQVEQQRLGQDQDNGVPLSLN